MCCKLCLLILVKQKKTRRSYLYLQICFEDERCFEQSVLFIVFAKIVLKTKVMLLLSCNEYALKHYTRNDLLACTN